MARGAKVLLLGCGLAVTGCVTDGVQVRPIADVSAKYRYSGSLLEQGRAQLALVSVSPAAANDALFAAATSGK